MIILELRPSRTFLTTSLSIYIDPIASDNLINRWVLKSKAKQQLHNTSCTIFSDILDFPSIVRTDAK
jgi:hypothetical protein